MISMWRSLMIFLSRQPLLIFCVVMSLAGCTTNPYTGRWQFVPFPSGYMTGLGAQSYAEVLNSPTVKISKDPQEVEPVQQVAERIIEMAKRSKYAEKANTFKWEVAVIKDDKMRNAFALPGGKIAVYTGIFPVARNTAGLAAILGHEVVHALAEHGTERMGQGLLAQIGLVGASIALQSQGVSPMASQAGMTALGLGTQVGILLPFSRKHESEADYIGLLLSAQAGYPPEEAVYVWERMGADGGKQPSEFLSTHPGHGTRIKDLNKAMPEARTLYEQSSKAPVSDLPAAGTHR
jgi:metalloendopeptidase OMA1, mitochondrial